MQITRLRPVGHAALVGKSSSTSHQLHQAFSSAAHARNGPISFDGILSTDPDLYEPIRYMERTRSYYLGLGFNNPYIWAHFDDVPFAALKKPLVKSMIGLVTTAAPFQSGRGDQGPGSAYNAAAKFYNPYRLPTKDENIDLRISHVAIDRFHANMADSR